MTEVDPEGVDPEVVESFGIPRGDVPRYAFVEAVEREEPEGRGKALLAMEALGLDGVEFRETVVAGGLWASAGSSVFGRGWTWASLRRSH